MMTRAAMRDVVGVKASVLSRVSTRSEMSQTSDRSARAPVSAIVVVPSSRAIRTASIIPLDMPVFEMAITTSPWVIIAAAMTC